MKMNLVFAALVAANLVACGQQEKPAEATQAPLTNETPATEVAPALETEMEAMPVEGEAPALEDMEESTEGETEAAEEPPIE